MNIPLLNRAAADGKGTYPWLTCCAAILIMAVAGLVLIGWFLDLPVLKSVIPGFVTMKFNTAFCFMLSGLALWFLQKETADASRQRIGFACALAVLLIASLTLGEYLFGWSLGLDEWAIRDYGTSPPDAPGRMSMATALCFLIYAAALGLINVMWGRGQRPSQYLAVLGMACSLIALEGYIFGVQSLYRFFIFSSVAVHTALLFFVLGLGLLWARAEHGLMSVITSRQVGGSLARRALPWVVGLPTFLAWLRLEGQRAGHYDTEIGLAIFATSNILIFVAVIWFSARSLNRLHADLEQRNLVNARYGALVESSMDAIISKDVNGIITSWNPGAEKMFGYSAAEMVGQPITRLIPPDQQDEEADILSRIREGERVEHYETLRQRKDGRLIHVSVSVSPIKDDEGKLIGASKVARDVTARVEAARALRAAEEQLKTIVDNLNEGLVISDREGKLLQWNPAALRLHGLSEAENSGNSLKDMAGLFDVYTLEGQRLNFEEWPLSRILQGETLRDVEMRVRRLRTDWERAFSFSGTTVRDATGRKVAFITIRDITARIRAEAELARSNQDLEQFAYVASHDLQEPLRAVAGCLQVLQRRYQGKMDARADELIGHAVDGSHRMQTLIEGLLAFSRVRTKGGEFQEVNCDEAVDGALKNLTVAIQESGTVITRDQLPMLRADPPQLTALFQNLIGNAIKFRGEKVPQIHLGAERKNGHWILSVRDNGIGIESQYFERIFVIFQRLHTRSEYSGTGIGLALCKKIMERHGGTISVESTPGQGSIFSCIFPA